MSAQPQAGFRGTASLLRVILLAHLPVGVIFGSADIDQLSSAAYPSIQQAVDANPGRMIFVPAGDHAIEQALRLTTPGSGLWGPGRIVQQNPAAHIVSAEGADRVQLRDLTLTRAEGRQDTELSGIRLNKSSDAVIENVTVIDNRSSSSSIFVSNSPRIQVRGCYVLNYSRITIDDRTQPGTNSGIVHGFAFNCINGTGINIAGCVGAVIRDNRIVELHMTPTPEVKAKYNLGAIVKKNAQRGPTISQEAWDANYVNIWRQGAAVHVGSGRTTDYIVVTGNYVENAQQGFDIQADHVIFSNNVVIDAAHGVKAIHGARNVIITGNQFSRNDLFGIGYMPGAASHLAGIHPTGKLMPIVANVDGYSVIASNIISDFGYGSAHWLWPVSDKIGPAPIQLGGGSQGRPPLRDVIVSGNVVYHPGRDGVLVGGRPHLEEARYNYAVRLVGPQEFDAMPQNILLTKNLIDPGLKGETVHDQNKED